MAPIAKDPSILRDFNRKFIVDLPRRDFLDEDEDKPVSNCFNTFDRTFFKTAIIFSCIGNDSGEF